MKNTSINTFHGGMNMDLDKSVFKNTQYPEAHDLRLVSTDGNENARLTNIEGPEFSFSISPVGAIWKIKYNLPNITTPTNIGFQIVINGVFINQIIKASNNVFLYQEIVKIINANFSPICTAYMAGGYVRVVSVGGMTMTISVSAWYDLIKVVNSQSELRVIGSCELRDKLIYFTCNDTDTDGNSQIWSVSFVEANKALTGTSLIPTVTLLYSGCLGFSRTHPIKAISKFETQDIQKVYFCDGYHVLRFFNSVNVNLQGQDESLFDMLPNVNLTKPSLDSIVGGGNYNCGVIQYAYQLYNTTGAETVFSPLSQLIPLTPSSESETFSTNYKGGDKGVLSGKSLKIKINNIDPSFENIRVVSLFREVLNEDPLITIVEESTIPYEKSITIFDDGKINLGTYTIDEFTTLGSVVFVPKSIDVKDDILFPFNVEYDKFDIDYDARAYRFNSIGDAVILDRNGDIELTISGGSPLYPNTTTQKEFDCINPYNDYTNDADVSKNYKFRADGFTLGGDGPNISFEFGITQVESAINTTVMDIKAEQSNGNQNWSVLLALDGDNKSFNNFASPYNDGLIVGYQRDEVYRLAIVLKDKKGRKCFPKWICDVRTPAMSEIEPSKITYSKYNGTGTVNAYDYSISCVQDFGIYGYHNFFNILYIKLNISIPADVVSEISGYEIVRVERREEDRTILSQGILSTFSQRGGAPLPYKGYLVADNPWYCTDWSWGDADILWHTSPELCFNENLISEIDDKLKVIARYRSSSNPYSSSGLEPNMQSTVGSDGTHYRILYKFKEVTPITNKDNPAFSVVVSSSYIADASTAWYYIGNYIYQSFCDSYVGGYKAYAGKRLVLKTKSPLNPYTPTFRISSGYGIYDYVFVNYFRNRVRRYGGNTYTDRTRNEYISCYYVPVDQTTVYTGSINMFSGDTYVGYFDYLNTYVYAPSDAHIRQNVEYYPCESSINMDLRHDICFNRDKSFTINESALYKYNSVYSQGNNINKYQAKPFNYLDNTIFDARILASQLKTNGEETDNWIKYLPADFIDLDSKFGSGTRIINHGNFLMAFQQKGFGCASVHEKSLVQDTNVVALVLGTGGVLQRFDYISTTSGSRHHDSIISTPKGIHYFDIEARQWKLFSSNTRTLSDTNGVKSYLDNNLRGRLYDNDNTHLDIGINAWYDPKYGEVVMSFRDKIDAVPSSYILVGNKWHLTIPFTGTQMSMLMREGLVNDKVMVQSDSYMFEMDILSYDGWNIILTSDRQLYINITQPFYICNTLFTLSYSEYFNCFNGFYDFESPIYMKLGEKVLCADRTYLFDSVHVHNRGSKGGFFGDAHTCKLKLLFNDKYPASKIYDNLFMDFKCKETTGVSVHDTFWDRMKFTTERQNSGWLDCIYKNSMATDALSNEILVTRKDDKFTLCVPKNAVNGSQDQNIYDVDNFDFNRDFRDRMRDGYMFCEMEYDNFPQYTRTINMSLAMCNSRLSKR